MALMTEAVNAFKVLTHGGTGRVLRDMAMGASIAVVASTGLDWLRGSDLRRAVGWNLNTDNILLGAAGAMLWRGYRSRAELLAAMPSLPSAISQASVAAQAASGRASSAAGSILSRLRR